ncbi:hypothetical protein LINGRAHAP2_LOCUS32590 [Linum grandiflorum]
MASSSGLDEELNDAVSVPRRLSGTSIFGGAAAQRNQQGGLRRGKKGNGGGGGAEDAADEEEGFVTSEVNLEDGRLLIFDSEKKG